MARTIKEGSWVHVRLPGRRRFTAEVSEVRPDGSVDLVDPHNMGRRTIRPEHLSPANKPRSLR